jgi:hypothetical protein
VFAENLNDAEPAIDTSDQQGRAMKIDRRRLTRPRSKTCPLLSFVRSDRHEHRRADVEVA